MDPFTSSSFEFLGFDVLPQPSSTASKTHESVSGKSYPRDNDTILDAWMCRALRQIVLCRG